MHRKHCCQCKRKNQFFVHRNHFVVGTKERNTVLYAHETLCSLHKRRKYCFLCTRNTLLSWQRKEKLFPVHKKHFVVLAKERNTVSCTQETLCCLGKRKKHCFLCTRNTLLSWQKKETLFLCTRNTLLSRQKKETLFSMHKKHFVVSAKERKTVSCT